ncbi:isochorismatase family protein [Streptomyces sp. NPDC088348]|uniref:isochorismatase family protein n=1 Tax=Streptomyces sp. NPDC088348 TaxID=3365853 RepID=UPI0037F472A4
MAWKVDAARTVLLVHDMQAYFLKSPPPEQQPLVDLVENAGRLRDTCAARGVPVVQTRQPGDMTADQRGLPADFRVPGMGAVEDHRKAVEDHPNSRRCHRSGSPGSTAGARIPRPSCAGLASRAASAAILDHAGDLPQ